MSDADPKTLYLIDGHAQIFRAYHAIRGGMSSPVTQEPTQATFGFTGMLLKLLRDYRPDYAAVAIDVSGDRETFRVEIDPQYKANREKMPDDLVPQIDRIIEVAALFGIPVLGVEGVEADDVIATLVTRLADRPDLNIRIVSRDKDLQQLLAHSVELFDIHKDEVFDLDALRENKGIHPGQVADVLALMGDSVDNIPGVKGIGEKTAAKLIARYGSIENLLQHTDELSPKQRENLEAADERLNMNRELVKLRDDVEVAFEIDDARVGRPDVEALAPLFKQLGFNRHLRDLYDLVGLPPDGGGGAGRRGQSADAAAPADSLFGDVALPDPAADASDAPSLDSANPDDYLAVVTDDRLDGLVEWLRRLRDAGAMLSVDTETDSTFPMRATLCGVSLAWPTLDTADAGLGEAAATIAASRGVYVPVRCDDAVVLDRDRVLDAMRPFLEDPAFSKIGQNLKYDHVVLRNHGVRLRGVAFDTMIASYLIDPTRSSHKLENLALAHLDYEMIPIQRLIGSGRDQVGFHAVPLEKAVTYAAEDADVVLRLHDVFAPQLEAMRLRDLFDELEIPVADVLAEMEYHGVTVDPDELDAQREAMAERIGSLRSEVINAAGVDFNPDSPKQLADVLFNQLGCKAYKRGKSGPSTDSEVLQRISDEQPGVGADVAALILEYRQLTKLVGTYLEALKQYIHPETGRIHASFNQTVAATGRLSSSDPNLQNIPVRTDAGRRIRRAFVAPEGRSLLGADYSQIELRLLAHLSGDEGLIDAFNRDADIHRAVAAEVFGLDPHAVDDTQRSAAKMVNFGIVYGITPYGLARRLTPGAGKDEVDRARQIIDDYNRRYPAIHRFLEQCVEVAETRGYVETIMKRRRPIPEIRSNRANQQQLGRRMAINTVVQGSAADLIKRAMIDLQRRIEAEQLPLKMLLQIHDELIFETPADRVEDMRAIVVEVMTHAMDLCVPLKVDSSHGSNWYEAK